MRQVLVRRYRVTRDGFVDTKLSCKSVNTLKEIFGRVPDRHYRATYTLSPDGKFYLDSEGRVKGYYLCVFPYNWYGTRFNRRVEIL